MSTRTDTLLPYTTRFLSARLGLRVIRQAGVAAGRAQRADVRLGDRRRRPLSGRSDRGCGGGAARALARGAADRPAEAPLNRVRHRPTPPPGHPMRLSYGWPVGGRERKGGG